MIDARLWTSMETVLLKLSGQALSL